MTSRTIPVLVLLCAAPGCEVPQLGPGDDPAIEITGYLDVERVSFTYYDDRAQAAGVEGATDADATVVLINLDTDAAAEATASVLGTFALSVSAADGDRLELSVVDAPSEDVVLHDVLADRPAFPTPMSADAVADPHTTSIVVELTFDPVLDDGHVWVINPNTDAAAVALNAFDHGTIHGGQIRGTAGDLLRLHWVPADGPESLPLELEARMGDQR